MGSYIINPAPEAWKTLLKHNPGAILFHSYRWRQVLANTFGYEPVYIGYEESGQLTAGMPLFKVASLLTGKRLVSSPYSAVGGCIGDVSRIRGLLDFARSELDAASFGYTQIRSAEPLDIPEADGVESTGFVDAEMDLDCPQDELWKGFPVSIRTAVRKAEKNGVTVRQGNGSRELNEFFRLNLRTRKGFGTPSFGKAYFRNIIKQFPGARFYLADYGGRPVNGVILVPWHGKYYYFYVGSDIRFRNMCGSDLLVWSIIGDAYADGATGINFGRMEKGNRSLAFFKKKWGSREIPLYYYTLPRGGFVSSREGFAYALVTGAFRRMPLWLAALAGPPLTKRLG